MRRIIQLDHQKMSLALPRLHLLLKFIYRYLNIALERAVELLNRLIFLHNFTANIHRSIASIFSLKVSNLLKHKSSDLIASIFLFNLT